MGIEEMNQVLAAMNRVRIQNIPDGNVELFGNIIKYIRTIRDKDVQELEKKEENPND